MVLEPLDEAHLCGLVDAVRDGELWKLWYTAIPSPDEMRSEIDRRLALQQAGTMLPFTVRRRGDHAIVGMTTYMNVALEKRRLEIGSTWYRASAQRTGVNTDAKMLLLDYAFDDVRALAVELRTSSFNLQSRNAIERLGAKLDGVLRHDRPYPNGRIGDTCVYSILAEEWPALRAGLAAQLRERS